MAKVIERIRGSYEAHETPYAKGYAWRPDRVVVECECGEVLALTALGTVCSCGADHAASVEEGRVLRDSADITLRPWREEHREWFEGNGRRRSEHQHWLEWSGL
jgi:hypothetical protein